MPRSLRAWFSVGCVQRVAASSRHRLDGHGDATTVGGGAATDDAVVQAGVGRESRLDPDFALLEERLHLFAFDEAVDGGLEAELDLVVVAPVPDLDVREQGAHFEVGDGVVTVQERAPAPVVAFCVEVDDGWLRGAAG